MGRSRSTPGLVESRGKIPLEEMQVPTTATDPSSSAATLFEDPARIGAETPSRTSVDHQSSSYSYASSRPEEGIPLEPMGMLSSIPQPQIVYSSCTPEPIPGRRFSVGTLLGPNSSYVSKAPHHPQQQQSHLPMPKMPFFPPQSPSPNTRPVSPLPTDYTNIGLYGNGDHTFFPPSLPSHFQFPSGGLGRSPTEPSQEALLAEIKRLRERLVTLEADNASMSLKLSQQQWEVENRLAEIELHICSGVAVGSAVGGGGTSSSIASSGSGDDNERNRESII